VVLASGEYDDARRSMELTSALLSRASTNQGGGGAPPSPRNRVASRFISTGRIYHQLPLDLGTHVNEALDWLDHRS
jgi:hypothetical protein